MHSDVGKVCRGLTAFECVWAIIRSDIQKVAKRLEFAEDNVENVSSSVSARVYLLMWRKEGINRRLAHVLKLYSTLAYAMQRYEQAVDEDSLQRMQLHDREI